MICVFYAGVQDGLTELQINNSTKKISNDEWNSSLYTLISRETSFIKSMGYKILIVGDTNGHLGKSHNPKCGHDLNSNGQLYLNYTNENELIILNTAKKDKIEGKNTRNRNICSGRWTYMEGTKCSIIDYVACTEDFLQWNVGAAIYDNVTLPFDSDHLPIRVWWENKSSGSSTKNKGTKKDKWSTTKESNNKKISKSLEEELAQIDPDINEIDEHLDLIISKIEDSANLYLKRKGFKAKRA